MFMTGVLCTVCGAQVYLDFVATGGIVCVSQTHFDFYARGIEFGGI